MAVRLNTNNFGYFAFMPSSPLLSKKDQKVALALTILMSVLTPGIGHLISSIVYAVQKSQMTPLLAKIDNAFLKKWLWSNQLLDYATDCLDRINRNVLYMPAVKLGTEKSMLEDFFEKPLAEAIAFCPLVPKSYNHFTLVYICKKTRTIEYYDSKVNYGDYNQTINHLKKLALKCDQFHPGETPYQVVPKIHKKLQPDSYQCGPWVLYFLEQRAQNPDVDFNQLDISEAQDMIADFRLHIMSRLIELDKIRHSKQEVAEKSQTEACEEISESVAAVSK